MTPKEMCDSCKHNGYCMAAYKKDHWCGNHQEKEGRRNEIVRINRKFKNG